MMLKTRSRIYNANVSVEWSNHSLKYVLLNWCFSIATHALCLFVFFLHYLHFKINTMCNKICNSNLSNLSVLCVEEKKYVLIKIVGTYRNEIYILKHIVLSQKNADRKEKCMASAEMIKNNNLWYSFYTFVLELLRLK